MTSMRMQQLSRLLLVLAAILCGHVICIINRSAAVSLHATLHSMLFISPATHSDAQNYHRTFTARVRCQSPPIDNTRAVMTVWRIKGKIIRTVLCCLAYGSCAQWYAHRPTHKLRAVSTVDCWFRFTPYRRLWVNINNLLSNVHILEAWSWCWQTSKSIAYCL